jgi:hypothetical protein
MGLPGKSCGFGSDLKLNQPAPKLKSSRGYDMIPTTGTHEWRYFFVQLLHKTNFAYRYSGETGPFLKTYFSGPGSDKEKITDPYSPEKS